MIRIGCELGKYPNEIPEHMDMDDLLEFAGYLSLQRPDEEKSDDQMTVEEKLVKVLGKPE